MDDLNIYDDLEEFDSSEKLKLKIEECNLLHEKYRSALKQIEELQLHRQSLQKKVENIEKSFSSLLTTARTEITRKTTQIADLRKELDDVCFRRGVRGRQMETREPQNAVERRREPHNFRHGYEKDSNSYDRSSSYAKNREEKLIRSHKSSERDHSRPRNNFKESEDKSSANHNISSRRNSLKDESTKSSHSTCKYNDNRHRDHISKRKEEQSNDRRKEEKSFDHRKPENPNSHRKEEKSNKYRKEEKINVHDSRNTCSKSLDKVNNASAEKSKRERNAVYKSREKDSPNKIKTKLCSQNKTDSTYNSLPELDLRQAILESSKEEKVDNIPLETAVEIKNTKIERRISLSAYRNRMNTKRSDSDDNANASERTRANYVDFQADNCSVNSKQVEKIINTNLIQLNENKSKQMPSPEKDTNKIETNLVQNKKDNSISGKREIVRKRTFEDILFDELVFEEDQNKDKRENHESEDECLYAGLEMEDVSGESNKAGEAIENSKDYESSGVQNKIQESANDHEDKVPNSNTEDNNIAGTCKSKTYFDSPKLKPESVKEVENYKEEHNIHTKMDSQQDKTADKQSSRDFLSFIIPSEQDKLETSRNDTNSEILPHDKESEQELSSTNKAEENLSSSNIFDASFEPECNKPASFISPYFGDQKTPVKYTNKSQLPREHNNSIENELAVMFKESPDQLRVLPPMHQTPASLKADAAPESKFQNKAKEMFDLYLASPTNVIPSEIENSKDRSPPNPTITGMKKRKSSTPRKSPGLLNGRGLKLVGHRIEGFEPGIRGEKALEASKLKNALFKEILGNETTSEEAAFRRNLQESTEEKDFQLNSEDVLEAQEENRSQTEEGNSKAINNQEDKIENLSENKKGVRFDVSAELSNENEKSADDNKVLKALECLENISDDNDLFSDNSSDLNGKPSTNNVVSAEHQGQQEMTENARNNDIISNEKFANTVENVKMEDSKDLDDEEIPATDESQQKMPSKVENEGFTEVTIEEGDEEVVSNPSGVVSDYNNRTNRVPFCSDKICVVIPLSTQDSIKSGELDFKKSPTTYSPEFKIAEKKLHSLKSKIKEDIQEDEVNIENKILIPEDSVNQHTSEPNRKDKKIKKYVEDFCKTIESVEEETVSDSIRSQASDQGTASSMRKRQSIVTFADLLKLPDRAKETHHSDSSKTIKTQSRTKLNLKNKRSKISSDSRKSIYIKSKVYKTEGFELKVAESSTKNKHKNPLLSSDFKKTTRHSKKMKGVFVRSLYVNSTQEKDIKILKNNSSAAKEVSVNELLFKSANVQSTRSSFKKDYSSECVMDTPIKPEPAIKDSPPEDSRQKYSSFKPKMPLIRTISQKRKGNVISPKKKRRNIEIVYSKEDEPFLEQKGADTSIADEMIKIDRAIETVENPNCAALTNENIRKMLASLDQANATGLKDSEDGEWCKENNKSDETAELSTENKVRSPPKEPSSTELEAPAVSSDSSVSSEKYNLFEVPVPTCEKIEELSYKKEGKKIKETLIELFGESPKPTPNPTPMPTPMSTPMPTPKRGSSDNDEVQCTFEQLNATNNNHQYFELLKDKEFKRQNEKSVQNKKLVEKSTEFEEQTTELSPDKNETDKNTSFVGQERDNCKNSERFGISKIKEPSPVKCAKSNQFVVEREKQKSIQPRVEADKENLSGTKRKISCLSDVSFDETKTESKFGSSLNNSGTDVKNNISTISTSSADYRIEAVSSDVVNVFITRKRRKKKA